MDPVTAALNLANTIAEIVKLTIDAMPADKRAEFATIQLQNLQQWQGLIDKLRAVFHHE